MSYGFYYALDRHLWQPHHPDDLAGGADPEACGRCGILRDDRPWRVGGWIYTDALNRILVAP